MDEDGGETKQCRVDVLNTVTGSVLGMFLQHKERWKKLYGTSMDKCRCANWWASAWVSYFWEALSKVVNNLLQCFN
jgi:hypothetical protein